MSTCGCHQCGGSVARDAALAARADALTAERVIRYASFIPVIRGQNVQELRNRRMPRDLYSRLALWHTVKHARTVAREDT